MEQSENKLDKKLITKDKKLNAKLKQTKFINKQSQKYFRLNELLTKEKVGFLEAEENEQTLAFSQDKLKNLLPIQNVEKIFDIALKYGQYKLDFSRSGKSLALGSSQGHLSVLDWKKKTLNFEINLQEKIKDIKFLQNENFIATAQKKHVYIYDSNGIELHCLKSHIEPNYIEYLPYHFLLVSQSKHGFLKYHDVTTGSIVAEYRILQKEINCMTQNQYNAIICLGDNKGVVSMYSPNTSEPLVKMLCHKSIVSSIAVTNNGYYLSTVGTDGLWKVWDLRTYKNLHEYWTPAQVKNSCISQKGLISLSMGHKIQIWKDWYLDKQQKPYMKHETSQNQSITDMQFIPYEDFMGVALDGGYQSIIVPGSGEPNLDSFIPNPYQTKKQSGEDLVHKLLEKIPSSQITLNPNIIGNIDTASKRVIEAEIKEEQKQIELKEQKKLKKKHKTRGRSKIGNKEKQKEITKEDQTRKNIKEFVDIKIRAKLAEKEKKKKELEVLNQMDDLIDFDPVHILKKQKQQNQQKISKTKSNNDQKDTNAEKN